MSKQQSKVEPRSPHNGSSGSKTKSSKTKSQQSKKTVQKQTRTSLFQAAPIYDLLRNFEKAPNQWASRYIVVITAIIIRSAIGLGSYSGEGQDPIRGDFEAQRHWMELTTHLPIEKWYFYDLQYWGLDYPPLTAFHSYLCGLIGSLFDQSWFALYVSRRLETPSLKNFMRLSALVSELIIYVPALMGTISLCGKKFHLSRMDQIIILSIIFYLPGLNLIDHGHFQYNSVMLGLFLFSLNELFQDNLITSSIWFMFCINFKQMGLYYAPFIFTYMVARLFKKKGSMKDLVTGIDFRKFIQLGITVCITQFTIILPFLIIPSIDLTAKMKVLKQIVLRVFPFQRGLFEDKVANFWCVSNILIKYRQLFELDTLTKLTLLATLISLIPSNLVLFFKYTSQKTMDERKRYLSIIYGFAATSWSFYLFSFQVHEKSVLIPLLPSTLLFCFNDGHHVSIIQWINNAAVFSMFPLLKKDGLMLQYWVIVLLSNWLISGFNMTTSLLFPKKNIFWKVTILTSYLAMIIYHIIDIYYEPPFAYPDLWPIMNATLSFGCFGVFWLWLLYCIFNL